MRYLTRRAAAGAATALALIALALLVTACGSSSSSSSSESTASAETAGSEETGGSATTASVSGSCGTIPKSEANDPSSLLAKLDLTAKQKHYYEGWTHPIEESAWANWKPKGSGPYKVAYVGGVVPNEFYAATQEKIVKTLEESGIVEKNIPVTAPASFTAIGEQLQQYNAAVQQEPDLIIFDPISPTATTHYVEAAGKKGIPTVSIFQPIETPYDLTVTRNSYVDATTVAAAMVKALGGKGKILEVLGTPTAPVTPEEQKQWKSVFDLCPEISIAGQAQGEFSTTVAKTATLQWLSTHPGSVSGVMETAAMGQGVLQAFEQAGASMPVIGQIQAEKSVNAYWLEHQSEGYEGAAVAGGATDLSNLVSSLILRSLEGQGPKVNFVPWPLNEVNDENLEEFTDPSWTPTTPGAVDNLPKYEFTESELDRLFNNP